MSYVREDGGLARARRRRQQRAIAVIIIAALLVFGAFAYAVSYMNRQSGSASTPASSCDVTSAPPPQSVFVLNIYNASTDSGQAKDTGFAMRSHGFRVGAVSNDPYKEKLDGVGQIRFGPKGKQNATEYVEKYAPNMKLVEDGRTDDSVDLVLGNQFQPVPSAPPTTEAAPAGC